jgi:HPt (histidine-containing phosphotransfer) domain-containing protein
MKNYEIPIELQKKYIERRWTDLKNCQDAFVKSDFLFLINLGHQLKGNAATYGHEKLGFIAEQIELFSKENNKIELQKWINQFSEYMQQIKND